MSKTLKDFFAGLTGLMSDARDFVDDIWLDLFPATTRELDAWETQLGLPYNSTLTDAERRSRLDAAWKATGGQSPKYIQDTLQAAGFPVYVHEWWAPGSEPAPGSHTCVAARDPNTYITGAAYVLVNKIYITSPWYLCLCGLDTARCGKTTARCNYYETNRDDLLEYDIVPLSTDEHHYFLYIGGQTFPALASIPAARQTEFEDLCLKICPTQLWLGILVQYT